MDFGGGGGSSGKRRKIAGFASQVRIITWKNLMLYKQNRSGIACEIIFSCLFTLIFVLLVYFANPDYVAPKRDDYDLPVIVRGFTMNTDETKNSTRMFYYPDSEFMRSIAQESLDRIKKYSLIPLNITLKSSNVSKGYDLAEEDRNALFALISFPDNFTAVSNVPDNIQYSIYTKETNNYRTYKTNLLFPNEREYKYEQSPEAVCQTDFYNTYKYDFFNAIKFTVDLSIIHVLTNKEINANNVILRKFTCPDYFSDLLKSFLSFFTPVLVSFAFLVTFLVTISSIIREKETKMKEYLRLIGVNPVVIWLCWMMRSFIIYLLISVLVTITSTVDFPIKTPNPLSDKKSLFLTTDSALVFITFLVYSIQVTSLSLLAGQIFTKPFLAKTVGIIFWFVTFFNYFNSFSSGAKYFFCIFPNTALTFATQVIFQYERSMKVFGFSKLFVNLFDDGLTLGGVLIAMLLWSAVYLILSWYIERIFPGEYGIKLPFYFPFMPSYWFENYNKEEERVHLNSMNEEDSDAFEQEPTGLYASVKIENLTKKFRVGFEEKTVVNNISVNFYENQITGFLGHNGAGKTTVTFMLCGMYTPNSGTAYILGHDIRTQMSRIRTSIGFCPQSNILYDELTVRNHLELVTSIKGFSKKEIKTEIIRIATYVGLQNDLDKKSIELSGGMKRRLSVAMALIGDSKVIILDEPTSGLDPYNRRSLWELIRNYKQGRTIILTTHYMEEADALSDRIALMNHGQVKCCGSPLFLKDRFGSGYRLTLSKDTNFNQFAMESFVENLTGRPILIESNIAREICIAIPTDLSSCLPQLLTYIEDNKQALGVLNYGISSSTVEEVFLKIGSIDVTEKIFANGRNKRKNSDQPSTPETSVRYQNLEAAFTDTPDHKNSGFGLVKQQIWALFVKRTKILGRRYVIALFTLFLPVFLEAVLSAIIPSSAVVISDAINSIFGLRNIPTFEFDVYKYGPQFLPANVNDSGLYDNFSLYLDRQAVLGNKPRKNLKLIEEDQVDNFVYKERKASINNIVGNYYFGLDLGYNSVEDDIAARGYYSTFPYHTSATLLNQLDSFLLAYHSKNLDRSISTINAPVSVTVVQNFSGFDPNDLNFFSCIEGIPFSYIDIINGIIIAFIIACTTICLIRERTSGSKSLQLLSGTHYLVYWLSNLIFDLCVYFFTIGTMILALKLVALARSQDTTNDTVIVGYKGETLLYLLIFMILASLSWALLAYVCSFLFKSDVIGFVVVLLVLGFACLFDMILGYLKLLDVGISGGKVGALGKITDVIRYVFVFLFPNISVKRAVFNLKLQNMPMCIPLLDVAFQAGLKNTSGFDFSEPGIGKFITLNYGNIIVLVILLYLLETNVFQNAYNRLFNRHKMTAPPPNPNLESDVRDESYRIKGTRNIYQLAREEPVLINDLCRMFKKNGRPFMAVNNLSFGVRPAECFGLLGLNGAGKTTTIQVLTGQLEPSCGMAFVNGHDISKDRLEAIRSLGYCPQFDYLPEYLTARESLELYANLRGLKRTFTKQIIDDFINAFKLNEFQNKLVQNLSGGNKRKVSSAIGFIGKPKTVILDEPTSGMDPAARRYLWNVIKHARDCGVTIILTTHSMEESEALCTNLGIMVNGQFECFGNIQHLKHKYGKGYSLIIKCKTDLEQDQRQTDYYVNYIERFIQSNIPNAFLKDKQQQTLFYQIIVEDEQQLEVKKPEKVKSRDGNNNNQAAALSIAKIFTLIETNKEALNIETYSLSQTTLEQVFLSFARKQFNPNEFNMPVGNQPIGGTYIRYPSNRVDNNNGAVNRAFDGTDAATIVLEDMRV